MASATPFYGLAIFDFGDKLDSPLNVQGEIDRFLVIDKQMYALYKIFGAGVIDGWIVEDNGFTPDNGISVTITPGTGIIRYIASESTFPGTVDGLPPNSIVNIYAVLRGSTAQDREIDFAYSSVPLGDSSILLAQVATGDNAVQTINNSIRQLIGFEAIIKAEIDAHHHRGTPSKIDLREETKNQLPGAKIESVDAQQITSGVFDIERMPQLNHDDLKFNGLLTHAELDAFVQSLSQTNRQLLGEVASVNLLKHILFMKYKFEDIDKHMINELAVIPGISPNSFIDFEATKAYVNLEQGCISGKPTASGEFVDVNWNTETSFFNAFKKVNVNVTNATVTLERDANASFSIENFEEVAANNVDIPGFTKSMSIIQDNLAIKSDDASTLKTEGFYSGKITTYQKLRAVFVKQFVTPQDWTKYDQLLIDIKTLSSTHGSVYCYFVNGTGDTATQSDNFLLLGNDEVTTNADPLMNSFAERSFAISSITRDQVTQFVVFTDDTDLGFEFYLDNIRVENTSLFLSQGTINLRYSGAAPVTFYSVFYNADTPKGTQIQVRVRTASATPLLTRASYTLPVNSGDVLSLPGTDAEIQVTLLTTDRTITPTLHSVKLRLLAKSEQHGFNVQNTSDWALGQAKNITINPLTGSLAQIELTTPINVGGIAFSYLEAIREIDASNVAVAGFSGIRLPISPPQAFNWALNPVKGFDQPVSVVRQIDKTYLIADMNNDRVLLMDAKGNLIQGFGSVTASDGDFYPFCSCYNSVNGVLTIVLSRSIDNTAVVLPLISLYLGTTQIALGASDTVLSNKKNNQILEIQLAQDKQAQLFGFTGTVTVNFATGAFPQAFTANKNSRGLVGIRGIECFLGNFTYMDGIQHPVAANILANGDWIVANSTVEFTPPASGSTGSVKALKANPTAISVTANSQATTTITGGTPPYNIKTGPNSAIATASLSGAQIQVQGTATGQTNVVVEDSSTLKLTLAVPISVVAGTATAPTVVTIASVIQFNPTTQATTYSSNLLAFSDFSLGAIEEVNAQRIAVAGIVVDPASLSGGNTGAPDPNATPVVIDPTLPPAEFFRQSAVAALATYRGIVGIVDKPSNNMIFQYVSPDGLYASDVDVDADGNLIVAESSFTGGAGRVVVLDSFGNIIRLYGNQMFSSINDAKSVGNGHILISV